MGLRSPSIRSSALCSARRGPYPARPRVPRLLLLAALALCLSIRSIDASAQAIKVGRFKPRPQLFAFFSLSVTSSPSTVNFALVHGGAATGSSAVAITTSYTGVSLTGSLILYAYFASAANALTGGSSSIPSSDVFGLVPTGTPTTYTAFTQSTPYSGASGLQIYNVTSLLAVNLPGSRTDNLSLKIDLASLPQLPAATYTGTITLEAQAF